MIRTGSITLLLLISLFSKAQDINSFVVYFGSKTINDKEVALSQKALDRREKFNIEIDALDYPVNKNFVDSIKGYDSITVRYSLRWHNAVVVESRKEKIDELKKLAFVTDIKYVGPTRPSIDTEKPTFKNPELRVKNTSINTSNLEPEDYGTSFIQNSQIGATYMHKEGYDGKGVTVAVFDAGFKAFDKIPAFAPLIGNKKVTIGYDLVDLDNMLTNSDNHGTAVSSCIASYHKGEYIGSAPNANFILFRTERAKSEFPIEELNWCKAAEMADSMGVDLITSSLGYTKYHDNSLSYVHDDLTGTTSYVSLAGRTAFSKGIVLLNSAGNEGDDAWRKIGTPADVANIITVGAVDVNDKIASFSSQGFNANGDIKPDVCGLGVLASYAHPNGGYHQGFGTSYATPIVSGGVACLLQAHPSKSPEQIANAVRLTASQNERPDSLYGYGIARIDIAHQLLAMDENQKPKILEGSRGVTVYNRDNNDVKYIIYAVKPFLLIFKRKTKEFEGQFYNSHPITHLPINYGALDCSKKYTLKVVVTNGVDKYTLKRNDLYRCPN